MTNKHKRKRAPGAGRKPKGPLGGKTANFSTRITSEMRVALEAEAAASGQSISQVAERLLALGVATIRDRARTNPTQALLYLIGELAEKCAIKLPNGKRFDWNTEPFVFEALQRAISLLFGELRPHGKSTLRDESAEFYARRPQVTSADYGQWAFWDIWDDILVASPPDKNQQQSLGISADDVIGWRRLGFDAVKVRRDLKIGEKRS